MGLGQAGADKEEGNSVRFTRAERVKYRLDQLGYTHQELADAIGYSRPYVTAVLNGRRGGQCLEAAEAQLAAWQGEEADLRRRARYRSGR